jgi:hypothetical protein
VSRIVIQNKTNLPDYEAATLVSSVMRMGMISQDRKGPHYCYATSTNTGQVIWCKRSANGFTFVVAAEGGAT